MSRPRSPPRAPTSPAPVPPGSHRHQERTSELARILLRLGADPDIRDHRFNSIPLGWARYFGQEQIVGLLEPLTTPEPDHPDIS